MVEMTGKVVVARGAGETEKRRRKVGLIVGDGDGDGCWWLSEINQKSATSECLGSLPAKWKKKEAEMFLVSADEEGTRRNKRVSAGLKKIRIRVLNFTLLVPGLLETF
jgi:hypothetical protein